jgi:hypothetical protein
MTCIKEPNSTLLEEHLMERADFHPCDLMEPMPIALSKGLSLRLDTERAVT